MLASRASAPPEGGCWLYDPKLDGVRMVAEVGDTVRLTSRRGHDYTDRLSEVSASLAGLAPGTVLDGELVALDEFNRASFVRVQRRIAGDDRVPVTFYAFDLLYDAGRDVRREPLSWRRERLARLVTPTGALALVESIPLTGKQAYAAARACGFEGIVAKRITSRYQAGRSQDWKKVKP